MTKCELLESRKCILLNLGSPGGSTSSCRFGHLPTNACVLEWSTWWPSSGWRHCINSKGQCHGEKRSMKKISQGSRRQEWGEKEDTGTIEKMDSRCGITHGH